MFSIQNICDKCGIDISEQGLKELKFIVVCFGIFCIFIFIFLIPWAVGMVKLLGKLFS